MSVLWFLLGVVVGGGATFFFVMRQSDLRVAEAELRSAKALEQAQTDARDADLAHRETKERLIALQLEHEAMKARLAAPVEASTAALATRSRAASLPASAAASPIVSQKAEGRDLKRIKGIGPALERRLNELGVHTLAQLAELSPAEVERINAKLDFPGRIQRERWIEQARDLLRS
jgi:predicted flap endonuclease-1-like 5' DNA nuclease